MLWLRMVGMAVRLAGPYVLFPWRSPLLRWRMETYGIVDAQGRLLHAEDIRPSHAFRFALHHRLALWRFLRWAARL